MDCGRFLKYNGPTLTYPMVTMQDALFFRRQFEALARGPEEDVDLLTACLYVAGEEYATMDVAHYLEQLRRLAITAQERMALFHTLQEQLEALSHYLFGELGFRGNAQDYYDPDNSYLNRVLDRRLGIPITLSILYMEMARQGGLILEGVGFPGHFVVRCSHPDQDVYIDPFNAGRLMSVEECHRYLEEKFEGQLPFQEGFLVPYTKKQTLVRLLTNLQVIHHRQRDFRRALAAADRIFLLDPTIATNLKERAALYYRLHHLTLAIQDLELYLKLFHEAQDREQVKEFIAFLWQMVATAN